MNLTHFVGLTHTGRQLLVFQTHNENQLSNGLQFLEGLKNQNLVDRSAYILKEEPLIYETSHFNSAEIQQINAGKWLEVLSTGHFQNLVSYISKWKQVFKPYSEVFGSP
jgi:hypothetical protein